MSAMAQGMQEDQLIELILQLKKTTPDAARSILNSQPQLSYVIMNLLIKMNAVDVQVLQKTLASYAGPTQSAGLPVAGPSAAVMPPVPGPIPAVPPHMAPSSYRSTTPQSAPQMPGFAPMGPSGYPGVPAPGPGSGPTPAHPGYMGGPPLHGPPAGSIPDALANMPEQQRAMFTRIIAMSPDDVRRLPPQERDTILQIRATLGLPTA